jgi:hypothetical protein
MTEDRPEVDAWYDLWHVHPFPQAGTGRWEALLGTWERVERVGRESGRPWQSWLVVNPADERDDAVYLHTTNPNRDNFPYEFEGVRWGVEPPAWLGESIDPSVVELGCSEYEGVLYWARRKPIASLKELSSPMRAE